MATFNYRDSAFSFAFTTTLSATIGCVAFGILADTLNGGDVFVRIGRTNRLRLVCNRLADMGVNSSEFANVIGESPAMREFIDRGTGVIVSDANANADTYLRAMANWYVEETKNPLYPYRWMIERSIRSTLNKGGKGIGKNRVNPLNEGKKESNMFRTYGYASLPRNPRKKGDNTSRIVSEFNATMGTTIDDVRQSTYGELLAWLADPRSGGVLTRADVYRAVNSAVYSRAKETEEFRIIALANRKDGILPPELGDVHKDTIITLKGGVEVNADQAVRAVLGDSPVADAILYIIRQGYTPPTFRGKSPCEFGISADEYAKRMNSYCQWKRKNREYAGFNATEVCELFGIHRPMLDRAYAKLASAIDADEHMPERKIVAKDKRYPSLKTA